PCSCHTTCLLCLLFPPFHHSSPFSIFFFSIIRPPPKSTLFPYTTLFRSDHLPQVVNPKSVGVVASRQIVEHPYRRPIPPDRPPRSEEHTSELQSLTNLVCRLLLEKKKKVTSTAHKRRTTVTQDHSRMLRQ